MCLAIVRHNFECWVYVHDIDYLSVVIDWICATFGYVIIGVFRYFQSVVAECPDLLLMFSLFVSYR